MLKNRLPLFAAALSTGKLLSLSAAALVALLLLFYASKTDILLETSSPSSSSTIEKKLSAHAQPTKYSDEAHARKNDPEPPPPSSPSLPPSPWWKQANEGPAIAVTEEEAAYDSSEDGWPYQQPFEDALGLDDEDLADAADSSPTSSEAYLTYHPHSQFNNQRSALQNAFVLADLLNRTLVVPNCYLGHDAATPWVPSNHSFPLKERIGNLDGNFTLNATWTPDRGSGIVLPCATLLNLDGPGIRYVARSEYERRFASWSRRARDAVFAFADHHRRQYRFTDMSAAELQRPNTVQMALRNETFVELLPLRRLAALSPSKYPVIHFNTLYGINALHLTLPYTKARRKSIERSLLLENPAILAAANLIVKKLGGRGAYSSAHFRSGDGWFSEQAEALARTMADMLEDSGAVDDNEEFDPSEIEELLSVRRRIAAFASAKEGGGKRKSATTKKKKKPGSRKKKPVKKVGKIRGGSATRGKKQPGKETSTAKKESSTNHRSSKVGRKPKRGLTVVSGPRDLSSAMLGFSSRNHDLLVDDDGDDDDDQDEEEEGDGYEDGEGDDDERDEHEAAEHRRKLLRRGVDRNLYIATDAEPGDRSLAVFLDRFELVWTLRRTLNDIRPTLRTWWTTSATPSAPIFDPFRSAREDVAVAEEALIAYAYPFVEQLVCSRARYFVGTSESTFSEFVVAAMIASGKAGRAVLADPKNPA